MKVVQLNGAGDKIDADRLRQYADMVERGEISSYGFIAEKRENQAIVYNFCGERQTHILGLLARLAHIVNVKWDERTTEIKES